MKLLFLDIDGVLNNELTDERIETTIDGQLRTIKAIDKELFVTLIRIIKATDVKIVLHSTWRNFPGSLHHFCHMLEVEGSHCSDWTICLGRPRSSAKKAEEIKQWLNEFGQPEKVAVLDDHKEARVEGIRFFQPDYRGLTEEMANEIISYFNDIDLVDRDASAAFRDAHSEEYK